MRQCTSTTWAEPSPGSSVSPARCCAGSGVMVGIAWHEDLGGWLEPFLAKLKHEKRRRWAPVYLQGLLGPGDRKSLQPTAARLGLGGHMRRATRSGWWASVVPPVSTSTTCRTYP